MDRREPLENGEKPPMLALRAVRIDDVVVQEFRAVGRRDGAQLGTRRMNDDTLQTPDLGRDMNRHGPEDNRRSTAGAGGKAPLTCEFVHKLARDDPWRNAS